VVFGAVLVAAAAGGDGLMVSPDFEMKSYQEQVEYVEAGFEWAKRLLNEMMDEIRVMGTGLDVERLEHDKEIEVLTAERDNALLRIDQLEALLEDADPNDRLRSSWAADALRGGVHPNA
jgi:hypothetical protein